jgi:two-component system nitrate/nitrite response regulator NarL
MLELRHRNPEARSRDLECPRVLIADGDIATRTGIRLALERDGFIVCSEEETADDAVAAALRDPPDLCLLAIEMPGGAIAAAEEIRSQLPETQVVMLSDSEEGDHVFAALEAGAVGYLAKGVNPQRLAPALRDVLNGRAALSRALTARVIEEFRARSQQPLIRRSERDLTAREWEVLDCLTEGLSTRRIGRKLFISETTVRGHIASILGKLGVSTRKDAVRLAAQRSPNLDAE